MKTEKIKLIVTANIQYTDGNRGKAIDLAKYCTRAYTQSGMDYGAKVDKVELMKDIIDLDLLNKYSLFLEKQGYMDTDWRAEEPFAIDEFMKSLKK